MCFAESRWKSLLGGALVAAGAETAQGQFANQQAVGSTAVLRQGGGSEISTTTSLDNSTGASLGGSGTAEGSLVRDAQVAQESMFRSFREGIITLSRLGYGQGNLTVASPLGASVGFAPLVKTSRPEGAELKVGRFYLTWTRQG